MSMYDACEYFSSFFHQFDDPDTSINPSVLQFDYLKQHSLHPSVLVHTSDPSRGRALFLLHLAAQNR